jgi:hypothetical protein
MSFRSNRYELYTKQFLLLRLAARRASRPRRFLAFLIEPRFVKMGNLSLQSATILLCLSTLKFKPRIFLR